MAEQLKVYEVGLRDGIQNHATPISTENKQLILDKLITAGVTEIELTSFVNPKVIPQLADAEALVKKSKDYTQANFTVLAINEKGFLRAKDAGCRSIAFVLAATETFSQKNNRMSVDETFATVEDLVIQAKALNWRTRIYVSVAWVCPYEGAVAPHNVLRLLERIAPLNADEIALSDTVGHANPDEVGKLIAQSTSIVPVDKLAVHLHDTLALGLANCYAAIQSGVRTVDSAIGGLGGCPFAPGAAGNLATEDLVLLAHKLGYRTGVDLDALWQLVDELPPILQRSAGGRTAAYRTLQKISPRSGASSCTAKDS